MALTNFGKAVRSARVQTDTTLKQVAEAIGTTSAFLSAIETGRKSVPIQWVEKIQDFFSTKGVRIENLRELADVANGQVSLHDLPPAQQMLMAGFARTNLDEDQVKQFENLLRNVMKK